MVERSANPVPSSKVAAPTAKATAQAATVLESEGATTRLWVAWSRTSTARPVFPSVCPCCLERSAPGAQIRVQGPQSLRFEFPACAVCARHVVIDKKITDTLGAVLFTLALLTVAVGLFVRGGWPALFEPFRSPIRLAMTAGVGLILMIVWGLLLKAVVIWPLEKAMRLHKPACKGTSTPVKWGLFEKSTRAGLAFENVEYGRRFAKENGL